MTVLDQRSTHEVLNQAPPLTPYNVFEADTSAREAVEREGADWGLDRLSDIGALAGSVEAHEHSERCERNEPVLRTHDRYGNRVGEVELDPSWHWLLREAIERGIHSLPWRDPQPGAHTVRAALMYVWNQVNGGVMCPVSMTYSVIPALRENPDLAEEWEPRLVLEDYEAGALAGMAMTEKQGGSDVRANTTRAEPQSDGTYEITGHKWFCSYPPCDVFLTLAQAPEGLSCFLIEGRDPGFRVQRLKDKLGTRSLPSLRGGVHGRARPAGGRGGPRRADDHPDGQPHPAGLPDRLGQLDALGHRPGDPPRPPPVRVRQAARGAAGHAERAGRPGDRVRGRHHAGAADGARLRRGRLRLPPPRHGGVEVLGVQARARATPTRRSSAWAATATWRSRACPASTATPRSTRSGRARATWRRSTCCARWSRSPRACRPSSRRSSWRPGANAHLDAHVARLKDGRLIAEDPQFGARRTVEDLGLALQASLLVRHAPAEVSDAFCASRLGGGGPRVRHAAERRERGDHHRPRPGPRGLRPEVSLRPELRRAAPPPR